MRTKSVQKMLQKPILRTGIHSMNHANRKHSEPDFVVSPFCMHFRILPVWYDPYLVRRSSDLGTLRSDELFVHELWRVIILSGFHSD